MYPFLCCLTFLTLIAAPPEAEIDISLDVPEDTTSTQVSIHIPPDSLHPYDIVITGDATIEGTVEGDIVISEGILTLEGSTEGDAVLRAGSFAISGAIKGDLVAIGGEGTVSGHIEGDAVFVGGILKLDSTAVIEGDLVVVSGELEKHPAAVVKGEETEVSLGPLGKMLAGVLSRRLPPGKIEAGKHAPTLASGIVFITSFVRLIMIAVLYLLGLLMLLALPRWQRRSELVIERTVWKAVLTGVVYRLAVGGIFAILIVSIIGWLLLPFAFLGWVFIALMSVPQASLWAGRWIKKWLHLPFESRVGLYSLGFIALYLLSIFSVFLSIFLGWANLASRIVRIIGYLLVFAVMTLGRGGIIYTLLFPREVRDLEKHLNQETNEKG